MAQIDITEALITLHGGNHGLLIDWLNIAAQEIAPDGIEIEGLIRAADGDQVSMQRAMADRAGEQNNPFFALRRFRMGQQFQRVMQQCRS